MSITRAKSSDVVAGSIIFHSETMYAQIPFEEIRFVGLQRRAAGTDRRGMGIVHTMLRCDYGSVGPMSISFEASTYSIQKMIDDIATKHSSYWQIINNEWVVTYRDSVTP